MLTNTQRNVVAGAIHELTATLSVDQSAEQALSSLRAAEFAIKEAIHLQLADDPAEITAQNIVRFTR